VFTPQKPLAHRAVSAVLNLVLIAAMFPNVTAVARTGDTFGTPVGSFDRVTTYDVPGQVAEIIASMPDGETLIYTDSASQEIGFVTLTDPRHPTSGGSLAMPGERISVAVTPDGVWALVAVHGADQDALVVVDLATRTIATTLALGGQPDSVAISPDGQYAAIAIENERDENVNGGEMPQGLAGLLTIVDLVGEPLAWTSRDVLLAGLAERFPDDPEPEYVSINASNQAAVGRIPCGQ
jgi:DNA-binding beta-propeller fold protein YncE